MQNFIFTTKTMNKIIISDTYICYSVMKCVSNNISPILFRKPLFIFFKQPCIELRCF